jgi:hypothetical protein
MRKISMAKRASIMREAARNRLMKNAGPLTDVSHLRGQAIFMMGAPGSGKGFVSKRLYLKYMPGGGVDGTLEEDMLKRELTEQERGLSSLDFEKAKGRIENYGFEIRYNEGGNSATLPFHIHDLETEELIPKSRWEEEVDPTALGEIRGLEEIVFSVPKHELPTYWRVVDPDMYKEELSGYMEKKPGYVHEMSSEMSKAYFEAAVETGDPLIVDGTGAKASKYISQMEYVASKGYKITIVWVYVPLVANLIRNSTRKRVVNSNTVTFMWSKMPLTWKAVQPLVQKKKVINTFDPSMGGGDAKKYLAQKDKVDGYIQEHTGYPDLLTYLLQSDKVPDDQKKLAKSLKWLRPNGGKLSPKEERMKELRERKNKRSH